MTKRNVSDDCSQHFKLLSRAQQFLTKAGEATRKCLLDPDSLVSCPKALENVSLVT